MELRQLRHFVAAVRHGAINRAAAEQHISQPALTRSIQKLEEYCGGELLERHALGVVPTSLGKTLFERAQIILNETDRAKNELEAQISGSKGHVTIGVGQSISDYLMTPAASRILQRYKRLTLTIREGLFEDLTPKLRSGELDFIVSQFPVYYHEADLQYEPLLDLRSPILCRREHPLAQGTVTREQLSATGWVLLEQEHVRRFHDEFFKKHKLPFPPYKVLTNSVTTLRGMLLNADLVALLPMHMVADEIASGRLVRVPYRTGTLSGKAGIVFARNRALTGAAEAAAEEVRAVSKRARLRLAELYGRTGG